MEEKPIYKERIEWCDIYKGLLMLLVVIGHSTGMFNRYIYQFHMAAFFIICGYTSSLDKRDFFHFVLDKFYKILMPFYFLGASGNLVFYILSRINVLDKVSTTVYSVPLQQAMSALFIRNMCIYCDWLGATWFLPVLFFATIWAKIIYFLAKKNGKWMFIFSVFVFFLSENSIMTGNHIIVLSGLAQFYFVMGILLKRALGKYDRTKKNVKFMGALALALCLAWYVCNKIIIMGTVNWPTKSFNGTVQDILLPLFGITVSYIFAQLLKQISVTNRLFSYIGKNTMGVMSFHFVGFKVAYALLILLGCMRKEDFRLLTPPTEVGNQYWFIIVFISVCFSLLLWKGLNRIRIVSFLLGSSKVTIAGRFGENTENAINIFLNTFTKMYARFEKQVYQCLYFVVGIFFILVAAKNIMKITDSVGIVSVTFPDSSSSVDFRNGWLPQIDEENCRWIGQVSNFSVRLIDQTELHIEGYVPDGVSNMSKAVIYMNDHVVLDRDINNGEGFIYDISISEYVKKFAENEIRIEFDGSRIPKETDADQRTFSALISAIEIR